MGSYMARTTDKDKPGGESMLPQPFRFLLASVLLASLAGSAAAGARTNAPPAPKTQIVVEEIAKGLKFPWGMQFLPDGRILVTERGGTLRLVAKDGKISKPVEGLPHVVNKGQGGLLDVLLSQDFATSGTIFFPMRNRAAASATARRSFARNSLSRVKPAASKMARSSFVRSHQRAVFIILARGSSGTRRAHSSSRSANARI